MRTATENKPLKTVELSKEQYEQLIEVCKIVFPEYSTWAYHGYGQISYFYGKGKSSSIHWFELCLNILPEKMFGRELSFLAGGQFVTAKEYVSVCFSEGVHPVYTLYEKVFKEYKAKIRYA